MPFRPDLRGVHPTVARERNQLEPLPETLEAITVLERTSDGDALLPSLLERGRRVREIVPDCLGISVASLDHDLTFTLVASSKEIALLDAFQYLADGPCVDAARSAEVRACGQEALLDERAWQLFASAAASAGVASTLTLPIVEAGRVSGTVNLYGASQSAFNGHHQEIADVFAAWAPGAVSNADLSFRTREHARQAPEELRRRSRIDIAVGILCAAEGVDAERARGLLTDAASRAGVDELELAEAMIELRSLDD